MFRVLDGHGIQPMMREICEYMRPLFRMSKGSNLRKWMDKGVIHVRAGHDHE
jgi:hypothetical protein